MSRTRLSSLMTLASLISGCMLQFGNAAGTSTATPEPPPTIGQTPSPEVPAVVEGWEQAGAGLELRTYRPGGNYPLTAFTALRIDPALYTFRAHYRPGDPQFLNGWQGALPDAVAFVNANFFDQNNNALGLVVADGIASGQSFEGYGGFVQVLDGVVRVRSNIYEPYTGEALEQAVQGFPMLVTESLSSYSNSRGDRVSRRTVAGQDAQGRIVLLITSSLVGMRLVDLSAWLPTTDLGLVTAVNLDGGGSSMMYVRGSTSYQVPSFDAVPVVLAVYPR